MHASAAVHCPSHDLSGCLTGDVPLGWQDGGLQGLTPFASFCRRNRRTRRVRRAAGRQSP